METKEKTRRPAEVAKHPDGARPKRTGAPKAAQHKQPEAGKRKGARFAADGSKAAVRTRKPSEAAPEHKKAPAPQKTEGYHPYRKANNRKRSARTRSFARRVSTFFSYQNPILRFFSRTEMDVFGDGDTPRQQKKAAQLERRKKRAAQLNTPAIIYTQPVVFNRNRLLVQLTTVLAVVLALVMGLSVFFKVKVITVSGTNVYSEWTIRENSGVMIGDNLLTFGRTKACGQIIANLPYVKSARIGIKLPDTVNIEVEEEDVVYAIQDGDGVWWLINSVGKVIEQTSASNSKNYTKVLGITIAEPQPGTQAIATEPIPTETDAEGNYVPVLVSGAVQLNAAMHILQALEDNDIVGSATSVDVTRIEDIILWYGTQYQVNLGNTERMDYKIACMNDVILQMKDYQTGILDISFQNMTDKVVYTPFG